MNLAAMLRLIRRVRRRPGHVNDPHMMLGAAEVFGFLRYTRSGGWSVTAAGQGFVVFHEQEALRETARQARALVGFRPTTPVT